MDLKNNYKIKNYYNNIRAFYFTKRFGVVVLHTLIALLVLYGIYLLKNEINSFCFDKFNSYTTFLYLLFNKYIKLYIVVLILLSILLGIELRKQYVNRNISNYRICILLVVLYALYNNEELRWVYIETEFFSARSFVSLFVSLSLLVEVYKIIRFNFGFFKKNPENGYSLSVKGPYKEDIHNDNYIISLIHNIKKIDVTGESFAIGITSPWGSGKTTFLNQLKVGLQKDVHGCIIIQFNPWKSSGKDFIIRDFFRTLQCSLEPYCKEIGKLLSTYAAFLLELYDDKLVTKFIKSVIGKKRCDSLNSLQIRIETILEKIDCPIYIFIDDLDRLDKEEAFEVLKLIRNSASFKRIIYIVAYDKNYLIDILRH